jgi:hypothetical protein
MPHAVLLDKPSVWQKLTGQRTTHQIATTWQLVAYEPVQAAANLQAEATMSMQPDASQAKPPEGNNTQAPRHSSEG